MEEKNGTAGAVKKRWSIRELAQCLIGDRAAANERLIGIISGIALGFSAYFLGRCELLFGVFPLGIAILCGADKRLPYILAGLCLSAIKTSIEPAVVIVTYIVLLAVRIFSRFLTESPTPKKERVSISSARDAAERIKKAYGALFTESVYLRMVVACIGAFCLSLYAIIVGGFRYYDLFGAFFAMVAAPVAALLFSVHFEESLKGTRVGEIGTLSLLVAVTYSVKDILFFGISVGGFIAFFATLCIGRRKGILVGAFAGLALGLAFEPVYAPLFVLEAAAAGVLWNISAIAAATAGCVVGTIWGVYVNGFASLSELLPAFLCGAMIFGAADRLSLITEKPELIRIKDEDRSSLEALVSEEINISDEASLKRLSGAFSELAEAFYNLSDRLRRPSALDLRRMCDGVFDKYCSECPRREICWGVEYSSTLEVLNKFTADLHMKARADISSAPEYLRERCFAMSAIVSDINENCARLTEHALMCDRTGVFALDYEGMSKLLSEALESGRADYIIDEYSAESVGAMLKKLRFSYTGVIAYGGRRKTVAIKGLDASRSRIGVKDLRKKLEELLGIPLSDPIFTPSGSKFDVKLTSRCKYSAKQYSRSLPADGSAADGVCGDTETSFSNENDYFYSILSDGMGSGKEAAFTSRISAMFLEKMLSANNKSETSLKLLNSFMSERDGDTTRECSVTVDLLEFDMLSGGIAIFKSGAAPTFIKRGNNCVKLTSKTLPLGILDKPDIERLRFEAKEGDVIIMVSDGVTGSRDDCPWLVTMLSTESFDSPADMADRIAETARERGSEDDITVNVIEIKENIA